MTTRPRLSELLDRLSRLVTARLHADGLVPAQWQALRYLARANRFSRSPKALTLFLGATKGTVSQTIIALERRGLVSKSGNPADLRTVRLDLTAAGSEALGRDPLAELGDVLHGLPVDRRRRLEGDLAAALSLIIGESGGRPFGLCAQCRHFLRGEGVPVRHCGLLDVELSEADSLLICQEQEPRPVPAL